MQESREGSVRTPGGGMPGGGMPGGLKNCGGPPGRGGPPCGLKGGGRMPGGGPPAAGGPPAEHVTIRWLRAADQIGLQNSFTRSS